MLYSYKHLKNHRIGKIHMYIVKYFRSIYYTTETSFSQQLLHNEFIEIVSKCEKLEEYLREIFDTYKKLDRSIQSYIYKGFRRNNLIEKLCKGLVEPVHYDEIPEEMRVLLKKFFYYLYDNLIGTVAYETACCSFHEYHQDFLRENGSSGFCPFCGLSSLTNQGATYRDDYDHYLTRSKYIFNSVNFRNLVPMCNICNSKVKGDKDIIYADDRRSVRRKAFFPYDNRVKLGDVNIIVVMDSKGQIDLQIKYPSIFSEEMESWIDIFDIKNRYKGVIVGTYKRWGERLRKKYKRCIDNDTSLSFSNFIEDVLLDLEDRGFEEKAFLEKAYLECLNQLDNFENDLKDTIGM